MDVVVVMPAHTMTALILAVEFGVYEGQQVRSLGFTCSLIAQDLVAEEIDEGSALGLCCQPGELVLRPLVGIVCPTKLLGLLGGP